MKARKLAALALAGVLCMSAFTGCGIDASEKVATLGDQEITLGIVNFMCKYQKAAYDDTYVAYYGKDVWDLDFYGTGTTLGDDLKNTIMSNLHDLYTLQNHMDDYDVTLTDEEVKEIKAAASAFMADNTAEALEEMGATQEYVEEMLTLYTIQWKMEEAIIADVDTEVSDEEANMRGISYVKINIGSYYDSSYNKVEMTKEEIAELKETAEKMAEALKDKTLEEVAKEHKYTVTKDAYAKDDEGFDDDLLKAMDALKEGEESGVIETKNALYIVRIDKDLDKEATEKNIESIIATRENELYTKVVKDWEKNDGWTVDEKVLDKIDFHHIFTQKDPNASKDSESVEGTESVDSTEK